MLIDRRPEQVILTSLRLSYFIASEAHRTSRSKITGRTKPDKSSESVPLPVIAAYPLQPSQAYVARS